MHRISDFSEILQSYQVPEPAGYHRYRVFYLIPAVRDFLAKVSKKRLLHIWPDIRQLYPVPVPTGYKIQKRLDG